MGIRSLKAFAAVGLTLAVGVGLAGCHSNPAVEPQSSGASTPALAAPIIVDVGAIDGTTVSVALNNVISLKTGENAVTDYSGVVADPAVAKFVPGTVTQGVTFNPGVTPLAVGTTTVTVTEEASDDVITFTVVVTAG